MINIELIWAIASFLTGGAIFYFANTSQIPNGQKTWIALFSGFLLSMGLVQILFMSRNLCHECQEYCPCSADGSLCEE